LLPKIRELGYWMVNLVGHGLPLLLSQYNLDTNFIRFSLSLRRSPRSGSIAPDGGGHRPPG
jgi:hypothetical protein